MGALIAGFSQLILIVLIIIMIMMPFGLAYALITGIWDGLKDGGLKFSSNVTRTINQWFTSDDASAAAKSYEDYLLNRFVQLADSAKSDSDDEIQDKQNLAVNWVYGKIYSSYFEVNLAGKLFHHIGFVDAKPLTYTYMDLPYTAKNIYVPTKETEVAKARKEAFGDDLNVYDLMAFDYVAGSLFDLLNLDILQTKKDIYKDNRDTIDKEIGDKLRPIYKNGMDLILRDIENSIYSILSITYDTGNSSRPPDDGMGQLPAKAKSGLDITKSHGLSIKTPEGANGLSRLQSILKEKEYAPTSNKSTQVFAEAVLSYNHNKAGDYTLISEAIMKSFEESHNAEVEKIKASDAERKKIWDEQEEKLKVEFEKNNPNKEYEKKEFIPTYYKPIYEVQEDAFRHLTDINKFIMSTIQIFFEEHTLSWDEKNNTTVTDEISALITEKSAALATSINTNIDKYASDASKKREPILENNINKEFKDALSAKIKALQLYRTEKAAETYRDALVEDVDLTTISYQSLDSSKLENLKVIRDKKVITDIKPVFKDGKYSINTTTISDTYQSTIYPKVSSSLILDADGKAIVSGIDDKTKINYLEGSYSKYFSLVEDVLQNDIIIFLNSLKISPENISKEPNSIFIEELKQLISTRCVDELTALKKNPVTQQPGFPVVMNDYIALALSDISENKTSNVKFLIEESKKDDYELNNTVITQNTQKDEAAWNIGLKVISHALNDYIAIIDFIEKPNELTSNTKMSEIISNINKEIDSELEYFVKASKEVSDKGKEDIDTSLLVDANLSKIKRDGNDVPADSKFIKGNKLSVKKFKNSQEEAIKIVARKHFPEVLKRMRGIGGNGGASSMDAGGVELGSSVGSEKFNKGLQYFPLIEKYSAIYGIDPNLAYALMIQESNSDPQTMTPVGGGHYAIGLMQIHSKYVSDWNLMSTPIDGSTPRKLIFTRETLKNPEVNIEAGVAQLRHGLNTTNNNIYAAVIQYNMGIGNLRNLISGYLASEGLPNTDDDVLEYLGTGDTAWLDYRSSAGIYTDNQINHLELVMSFYDTDGGTQMPWVIDPKTKETIHLGSIAPTEGVDGKKTYHKNNELVFWKEYYTDNEVFSKANDWSKDNNTDSKFSKDFSELIISNIESSVADSGSDILGIGIPKANIENILAGAINLENQFKIPAKTDADIKKYIDTTLNNILTSFKAVSDKGKHFSLYHFVATNKDLALYDLQYAPKDFKEFYMEKKKLESDTTSDVPINFKKVAQVISGNIDVNISEFYKNDIKTPVNVSPENQFYNEWLDAKAVLHELYNVVSDDRNPDGSRKHEELPPPKGFNAKDNSKKKTNSITVSNSKGYPSEMVVYVKDKPLEKLGTKDIRKTSELEYIVIHEADFGAEELHRKYSASNSKESMNYVIDSSNIYKFADEKYITNHLSDKPIISLTPQTNSNSIGIEISKTGAASRERTLWNTVAITKHLMTKYGIPADNVVLHKDVTNKDCRLFMSKESSKKDKTYWDVFKEAIDSPDVTITENMDSGDINGFTYFSQLDPTWSYKMYGDESIGYSGCGPTSVAIILSGLNADISLFDTNKDGIVTPDEMAAWSLANGHRVPNVGTAFSLYHAVAEKANLKITTTTDLTVVKDALKRGAGVIGSYTGPCYWIKGGHLLTYVDITEDGTIITMDPNTNDISGSKNGPHPDNLIKDGLKQCFIFENK